MFCDHEQKYKKGPAGLISWDSQPYAFNVVLRNSNKLQTELFVYHWFRF